MYSSTQWAHTRMSPISTRPDFAVLQPSLVDMGDMRVCVVCVYTHILQLCTQPYYTHDTDHSRTVSSGTLNLISKSYTYSSTSYMFECAHSCVYTHMVLLLNLVLLVQLYNSNPGYICTCTDTVSWYYL